MANKEEKLNILYQKTKECCQDIVRVERHIDELEKSIGQRREVATYSVDYEKLEDDEQRLALSREYLNKLKKKREKYLASYNQRYKEFYGEIDDDYVSPENEEEMGN